MRYLTLCAAGAMLLAGCAEPDDKSFPGYAEGEYVRVGAPLAGTLLKLAVRTGDTPDGRGASLRPRTSQRKRGQAGSAKPGRTGPGAAGRSAEGRAQRRAGRHRG
ncbi:hypothetical protein LP420_16595 [Massilia sp. B-10]|nr:hypothetical protein LP420_16595 [Massilia sp. B-10]